MTEQEIKEEMKRLVYEAEAKLVEAERFAEENKIGFSWEPAYGMGGWYDGEEQQWYPSSESC
jgi:hypothetical protein